MLLASADRHGQRKVLPLLKTDQIPTTEQQRADLLTDDGSQIKFNLLSVGFDAF
jgi:hypothetical protein